MSIEEEEKLSALQLIRSENIGIRTFLSLLKLFGSATNAIKKVHVLSKSKPIKLCSREDALIEIDKAHEYGAEIIYFKEDCYPALLKETSDFPPIITVFGQNKELLNKNKIAVIGSRNASLNGTRFAYKLAHEISEHGYTTVSGLARGIDSYVHRGSIAQGTIAVIAGGIDNIYPPENMDLYKEIAHTGLIISENPFGTIPKAQNFPQRNRIISGLAIATAVIEASLKSGSLITANFALEQNREVFAVPGFPLDSRYSGTNKLIKQGAHVLENIDDLLDVIKTSSKHCIEKEIDALFDTEYQFSEKNLDFSDKNIEKDLAKAYNLILSILTTTPVSIDDIIRSVNVPINLLMVSIIELELMGKIQRVNNTISLVI